MAKGVKRSISERKADLQSQLELAREKVKTESAKVKKLEDQIKELEVEEQAEILSKLHQAADDQGTTVEELLRPIFDKQKKSV